MELQHIMAEALATATAHGFVGNTPRPVPEHVALLHEEVSELFGCWRDGFDPTEHRYEHPTSSGKEISRFPENEERQLGKPVGIPSELADVVIRACQFAAEHKIDLERAILEKMAYNAIRPMYHGRKGDAAARQ
jgi:NTP pyrophosphatase (non-canonical NTP hydrolase)